MRPRAAAGVPAASVDLALHIGEVLYGNVGATDRLDFTVIGPAVNEVARIEALCEPLGRPVLVSAEFAAAVDGRRQPPRVARPPRSARRPGAEGDFRAGDEPQGRRGFGARADIQPACQKSAAAIAGTS